MADEAFVSTDKVDRAGAMVTRQASLTVTFKEDASSLDKERCLEYIHAVSAAAANMPSCIESMQVKP